jgi:hypothetical protein
MMALGRRADSTPALSGFESPAMMLRGLCVLDVVCP